MNITEVDNGNAVIHGVTAIDASGAEPDAWILVEDSRITARGVGEGWRQYAETTAVIDGTGHILTPGFIDIHMHGGGGGSNEGGVAGILTSVASHRAHGVTRAVVSLVANPVDTLVSNLRAVALAAQNEPSVLGSHLEGPYLAPTRKGAHRENALIAPSAVVSRRLLDAAGGTLRHITLAPELPGAAAAIQTFRRAGVRVAVGHTEANLDQTNEAFALGASLLTHAFNAMAPIHHRDPGPVVAALRNPNVFIELIMDGIHVDSNLASVAFAAAPHRVILVSDAISATDVGDGEFQLGEVKVRVTAGRAVVAGSDTLAGSTLTLDRAVRMAIAAGIEPAAAVEAVTLTPARALGLETELGLLAPGKLADLVLLSHDWTVRSVIRAPFTPIGR